MRVVTWNLYHGRAVPPAGRPLLREFALALAGWDWDLALLQEVPPWWPATLADAAGADHHAVRTARNRLLPVRRAIAARAPDRLKANGGGANAILHRVPVVEHRALVLTRRPERRVAHGVRLADGTWVVNLHATLQPKARTRADIAAAAAAWADADRLVLGGDLNLHDVTLPDLTPVAVHGIDQLLARGWAAAGPAEVLDPRPLSDHRPVAVALSACLETGRPVRGRRGPSRAPTDPEGNPGWISEGSGGDPAPCPRRHPGAPDS